MIQFFAENYTGTPFVFFGSSHLIALGIVVLLAFSPFLIRNSASIKLRKIIRYGLASILIFNQISRHIWINYYGQWSIQWNLPLHMCSLFVWLSAYMLITKSYLIFELAYFLGIAGALQALLTPDAGTYGFEHYYLIQFFIAHGSIIIASSYMAIVEGFRPTWRSIKKVFISVNIYLVFITVVNLAINSNYLYSLHKPHAPTLLDYLGPWPWYILSAEGVAAIMFLILYLPYLIKDLRNARTATTSIERRE
ncbi:MAG: TIGR02206 family membrane protein [Chloroflexota bacterium]